LLSSFNSSTLFQFDQPLPLIVRSYSHEIARHPNAENYAASSVTHRVAVTDSVKLTVHIESLAFFDFVRL
jgi:hypothetical protein